jgi:hypothetical protein
LLEYVKDHNLLIFLKARFVLRTRGQPDLKINGKFPLNKQIPLKMVKIEGDIPPIYSKNMKIRVFA